MDIGWHKAGRIQNTMSFWSHIEQVISDETQHIFRIRQRQALGGGSINNAYKVSDGERDFFVKTNRRSLAFMFEAEMLALNTLHETRAILTPKPLISGIFESDSFLVMQYMDLSGPVDSALFGEKMANLHQHYAERYGFDIDNSIGSTPQINAWDSNWVHFWQKNRLGYQLELCKQNGYAHQLYDLGQKLIEKTPYFFQSYTPKPSLLHGDLWSGNWSATPHSEPVIFDPASYYGDQEADLAMTELFGHPGIHFYEHYKEHNPINDGYAVRKLFYNVYHLLNHANLFGGGYIQQSINSIEQLLVE